MELSCWPEALHQSIYITIIMQMLKHPHALVIVRFVVPEKIMIARIREFEKIGTMMKRQNSDKDFECQFFFSLKEIFSPNGLQGTISRRWYYNTASASFRVFGASGALRIDFRRKKG